MEKVELLSPAGNYESLVGALNAGADAVYLGGEKFGARAYADNFTEEELCKGIRYAHLLGKKIFLTVNTLVKEKEFGELYGYMKPLYEAGLDGVIIQDLGVFQYLKEHFPGLYLHASTQMTITGKYGAEYLKKLGAVRVVPARELSLQEIQEIRNSVDIELETFVHGAICYCYSGQCLFSSMVGGRSGNRGRCAQPCRLPYDLQNGKKECYPLSMKDMCLIDYLPELIQAGIHSFKIEGRMKKPEYTAGVTAIYRKYIDAYYANPDQKIKVSAEDKRHLASLYIRTEAGSGYYFRKNGREMITLDSPSYAKNDALLLEQIHNRFLTNETKLSITGEAWFQAGKESVLQLNCREHSVTVSGDMVEQANKQPLEEETITKQLTKLGNTSFVMEDLKLHIADNCYMNIKALNQLRRAAVTALEKALVPEQDRTMIHDKEDLINDKEDLMTDEQLTQFTSHKLPVEPELHIMVKTVIQLKRLCKAVRNESISILIFFSKKIRSSDRYCLMEMRNSFIWNYHISIVLQKKDF